MAITKVTNSLVAVNAIQGTLIADNAITSVHIAQNQVTAVQIPDGSITSTQIAANSIDTAELVTGSIDTIHIGDSQVTTAKIADLNVTTGKIANNAITAAKIPDGSITETQLSSSAAPTFGNITTTGSLRGPASFTIDPAAVGDNTGTVVIAGSLQVDGTTTTVNSTTLSVADKNIVIASGAADAAAANEAGLTVTGASATLLYKSSGDKWSFNKDIDVTGTVTSSSSVISPNLASPDGTQIIGLSNTGEATFYRGAVFNENSHDSDFRVESNNNTHMLFVDAGNDRVGIGTTSPGHPLNVVDSGELQAEFSGYSHASAANNSRAASGSIRLGNGAGTTGLLIDYTDQGQTVGLIKNEYVASGDSELRLQSPFLSFYTGTSASEAMRINPSGNVGIGNNNPAATLEVGTLTSGQTGTMKINNEGGNTATLEVLSRTNRSILKVADNDTAGYISAEGGILSIGRSSGLSANNINIDSSHNIGIGETSPDRHVHITGNTTTGGRLKLENTSASFYAGTVMTASAREFHIGVGGASVSAGLANSLYFYDGTAGLNRMYLDASGNFNMVSTLGSNASTTYGSMGNRIMFDNDYSDTQRGPNKIVTQNDGAWIAGLGISNNSADFYSGGNFTWLDSGGADSYVARMRLSDDGDLQIGYNGAGLQQADGNALTITTPASGGGQGISLKRLDSNNDQVMGQITWSNNTQDGLTKIYSKTEGATNSSILRIFCNEAGTERQVVEISPKGTAGDANLQITNHLSNSFNHLQENLCPGLTQGETAYLGLGKENNTKNTGYLGYYWYANAHNDSFLHMSHWGSNYLFRVYGDGRYYHAGSAVSDRDLKENILEVSGTSLDKIVQIPIKSFRMKKTPGILEDEVRHQKTGFIAQEVQPHLPDVVTGTDGEGDMGIDATGMIAHLVRAVKELKEENDALKARITTLEG